MPAQDEFDDRYLPLFIFERQARRSWKRGWTNVNKRYHAYLAENGEIMHIIFKTWKTFIKALNTELDKTRIENKITEETVNFSLYENIPCVTLHQCFFSDEVELIENTIKSKVEDRLLMSDILCELEKVEDAIRLTHLKIEEAIVGIEDIKKHPEKVVVPVAVDSLIETEADIEMMHDKFYYKHGNLKLIRHDYYAILKERQKLSAKLHDTIHTILYATSPEYRGLCAQKKSLEELISTAVENNGDKVAAEIMKREDRLEELENRLQALMKQREELMRKSNIKRKEIEKMVRAEVEKNIIPDF